MLSNREVQDTYSLKVAAYNTIRDKILKGRIKPGERIREDLLAEEIGISRTPVREATNRLVMDGLIVNVPRRGLYCLEVTEKLIDEVCDLRKIVDIYAVERCSGHLNEKQVDYLLSLIDQMKQDNINGRICVNPHELFHNFFVEQAGNELLLRVKSMYDNYLTLLLNLSASRKEMQRDDRSQIEHRQLVEFVRDGWVTEAKQISSIHVDKLRVDLKSDLKQKKVI